MVDIVRAHARSDPKALPSGMSDKVLEAMGRTLRHKFIPDGNCAVGYMDRPMPIGHSSTISQPYIVALMTELAAVPPDGVALEIGTGSGYQAAILAQLTRKVCTIEIVQPLAVTSALVLRELGYDNVDVRIGDGYQGWPECGPFDAIIVTAALGEIPPPLHRAAQGRRQARHAGRLARPVQLLMVIDKVAPDKTTMRAVTAVRFVPFQRPQCRAANAWAMAASAKLLLGSCKIGRTCRCPCSPAAPCSAAPPLAPPSRRAGLRAGATGPTATCA